MKILSNFLTLIATVALIGVASHAWAAANYTLVCNLSGLSQTEKKECRVAMRAAKTDQERAELFRKYDQLAAGIKPGDSSSNK